MQVGKLRKLVYLLMASMLFSAPLLACSLPGLTMSDEEKECCRQMADRCGGSQMDESHSCCTKAPTVSGGTLHATAKYSPASLEPTAHIAIATVQPVTMGHQPFAEYVANRSFESPPGHTSVLRI
jgi:hypothetical protein